MLGVSSEEAAAVKKKLQDCGINHSHGNKLNANSYQLLKTKYCIACYVTFESDLITVKFSVLRVLYSCRQILKILIY